jgi:hypothetical protein
MDAVSGGLRVEVQKEGLYKITSEELQKYIPGWERADPAHFHLTLRGQEQPLWITSQKERFSIFFYGYPGSSRYSRANYYLLGWDEGVQSTMLEHSLPESSVSPAEAFLTTIHVEENNKYAPQVADGDHIFWLSMSGGQQEEFDVDLPKLVGGDGHLRIHVWGSTSFPNAYDHHLLVSLNEKILIDEQWDGAGRQTLEADIPDGLLVAGENKILVAVPGDTGAAAEINFVDWIEVGYHRRAEAEQDFLAFDYADGPTGAPLHLYGFSDTPVVIDVTVPTNTIKTSGKSGLSEINFLGEAGHRYLAAGPKGFASPSSLAPAELAPDLHAAGNVADYVVIGPRELLPPLTPLLDWRSSQGLKVVSVPLEAVYDQFNAGFPEPEAIKAFISYAMENWQPAPRYLLLVGDATYDPREYISTPEANRLPVILMQTNFGGETASDVLYGDVDGDQLPDLAVGRIPAQNTDQVRVMVEKILQYEQSNTGEDWRKRILAIADGQEISFKSDAQVFLKNISAPFQGTLFAPEAGVKEAPDIVKDYIDDGYGIVAYFGHGSMIMWGKDRIFTAEDVSKLSNREHLPVVINMTCLTGLFIHPKVTSITEELLWHEDGGVVAMLAPTSLTLPGSQSFLSQALINTIVKNPGATLGENYLQAQRSVPINDTGAREVLLTFLMFGDPALRLNP